MVWDELTSTDSSLMQGMMGTHDQECKKYFKDSKVHAIQLVSEWGRLVRSECSIQLGSDSGVLQYPDHIHDCFAGDFQASAAGRT